MKNLLFCALVCASVMISCNSGNPGGLYIGEAEMSGDTLMFHDYATGRIFNVSRSTQNLPVITEQYSGVANGDSSRIYMTFTGKLETSGQDTLVKIGSLEYLGTDYQYQDEMFLATTYRNLPDMELLELNEDYTYALIKAREDDPGTVDTVSNGRWGILTPEKVVLKPQGGKAQEYTIMFNMFKSLVRKTGNTTKLYAPSYEDR